ncbi:putative protein kinase RLK-Pelle-LRR-VIII-1 family [Helianthus annuus]|nr:putative protein kinase RLK-Pelle-LRR-VIII-1 family [Helianthus annuus]KAJ0902449.1 putative protein kinase RLK-Pelle-LRR-VIII-1 family [Helianthus annuus]
MSTRLSYLVSTELQRASSWSNGVYKGSLPNGQLIAIKRAQEGSSQGGLKFKNEIELLSRVHDKNVVGLIGFCFDKGEQMLLYEYIVNMGHSRIVFPVIGW